MTTRRLFTTAEYHQMVATSLLTKDDRVELLNGKIVEKARISPQHAACVTRLSFALHNKSKVREIVSVQHPIELAPYSEPEPDLALLKRRADFYATAHPTAADVLLAVEVADTTIERDRATKLPLYARAGIVEMWLVDLYNDRIEIHNAPQLGVYQEVRIVQRGQRVVSQALPQLKLKASEILG